MGFTPSSGKELQSDTSCARRNAVEAIAAVERLRDHVSPHLMITELRTIDADDLWMSTCYKRPSLAIHFTWKQDWAAGEQGLADDRAGADAVRRAAALGQALHPRAEDAARPLREVVRFKRLVAEHDPKGKFRNAFLATNLYGA